MKSYYVGSVCFRNKECQPTNNGEQTVFKLNAHLLGRTTNPSILLKCAREGRKEGPVSQIVTNKPCDLSLTNAQ